MLEYSKKKYKNLKEETTIKIDLSKIIEIILQFLPFLLPFIW